MSDPENIILLTWLDPIRDFHFLTRQQARNAGSFGLSWKMRFVFRAETTS
jgi:hypothetical protein